MFACIFVGANTEPVYTLGSMGQWLLILNVNVGFVGSVLVMVVNNVVKEIVARHTAAQIEEYRSQAYTDPLTGLHNRRYAEVYFEQIRHLPVSGQWCVSMLDIDDFKRINDTYGHDVGDEVLKSLANIIADSLRKTDTVIRWGGEEFLLILGNVNTMTACFILEKLRNNIENASFAMHGLSLRITVTIGVASLQLDDIEGSISASDKNLYSGKTTGKNKVVV
jgi:diguanylate cyclase (GGDEF)-like protein